ncbi:CBS domain-containing protein [Legionella jordanis]|uniref:CBS domain protein n=1 Tax=Legionella jordanis TaxID=456 RepID=A0A0W0VBY9_9GAMM|nr:CBS domain-containing protein [Legionella jordanis]KTD17608.1 CBS domain protein [Legionella jordanis]RMX00891.1 CBS domain-containing protein [Legionella jordanis]RMX17897.1 CBS domain-containing protein [Legionella jordanis]VEH11470.1 CBS domain protein [Legionella jordanis]HAT8714913.1 CBS domain-containing protein [Legionella jordanis]
MEVKEIMTPNPEYLLATSTIKEAAKKMRELDTGFLPIGDKRSDKLVGTITDRDIVISALADDKGLDTPVTSVMHKGVYYCYETDDIKEASKCMKDHQIRRLIVLNKDKKLAGIVSLGDIAVNCQENHLKGETLEEISKH